MAARRGGGSGPLDILYRGDDEHFIAAVTSGEVWGHMGSLFDNAVDDAEAQHRFDDAQLRLANELSRLGITSRDLERQAEILRQWRRSGLI